MEPENVSDLISDFFSPLQVFYSFDLQHESDNFLKFVLRNPEPRVS